MKRRTFALAAIAGAAALVSSCATNAPVVPDVAALPAPAVAAENPPPAPREFRAAWVSTVANIDWPTKSGLSTAQQQAEVIAILERAKSLNLNAIVLQVRPAADAIYPSKIEPWTEYLSGTQGQAPQPFYDPLQFWVTEAHARGIELHAWFNPYRARHSIAKSPNARSHISNTNPAAVKQYGNFLWMDPGEESASRQTLDVVLDVVRRYDIDGVHLDDYFYPYPVNSNNGLDSSAPATEVDFPDQPAWARYQASGGTLDRASWRRDNVNRLIERLYKGVHGEKSWVKFGISPFGIARPDRRPPTISGFSQYDKLYADAELWLEKGWVDYFTPQLYWPRSQVPQAFDTLLDYWISQNTAGRHMWPGLFTSRIGAAPPTLNYEPQEVLDQIGVVRSRPGATGHVHFSMAALTQNRKAISDQLRTVHYTGPALVPATPWLAGAAPDVPRVTTSPVERGVELKLASGPATTQYAIWTRYGKEWRFDVAPASRGGWVVADDAALGKAHAVVVSSVDRLGVESARVTVPLQ